MKKQLARAAREIELVKNPTRRIYLLNRVGGLPKGLAPLEFPLLLKMPFEGLLAGFSGATAPESGGWG
jgi:hypothetical protein